MWLLWPPAPGMTLRSLESLHIADALRRNGGNRKATARELGIDPSTLYRKMRIWASKRLEPTAGAGRAEATLVPETGAGSGC